MFEKRGNDIGIIRTDDYPSNNGLTNDVQNGDNVTLKIGEERVSVRNIKIGSDSIKGEVVSFEPSFSVTFQGIKLGEIVSFKKENIFGCSG